MWYESNEEKIRKLQDNLYEARRTILQLLPRTVQEIAEGYYLILTRRDAHDWLEKIVEAATQLAWPYAQETAYSGARAYCPLCRHGTNSYIGEEGFLLPGGMRKHLLGEGNAHECDVMHQVRKLAETYWRPRVEEAEAQERAQKEAELEMRRASEDQFRVDPSSSPQLIDESYAGNGVRDDASLGWAIDRLSQLGFKETRESLVRQLTKEYPRVVVYADPRKNGRIEFSVYRREQVEKPKSRKRWMPHYAGFHLLDTWRNDLISKFEQRVQDAGRSLRWANIGRANNRVKLTLVYSQHSLFASLHFAQIALIALGETPNL